MELRKLKLEQRRREQEEAKKRDANNKDSVIQEILKNDKMSKFAKTVAIKNLSVASRNKRPLNSGSNSNYNSSQKKLRNNK